MEGGWGSDGRTYGTACVGEQFAGGAAAVAGVEDGEVVGWGEADWGGWGGGD